MGRRCMTTTRSSRSTTAKKISLSVRRLINSQEKQRPTAQGQSRLRVVEQRKNTKHGVDRGSRRLQKSSWEGHGFQPCRYRSIKMRALAPEGSSRSSRARGQNVGATTE